MKTDLAIETWDPKRVTSDRPGGLDVGHVWVNQFGITTRHQHLRMQSFFFPKDGRFSMWMMGSWGKYS